MSFNVREWSAILAIVLSAVLSGPVTGGSRVADGSGQVHLGDGARTTHTVVIVSAAFFVYCSVKIR